MGMRKVTQGSLALVVLTLAVSVSAMERVPASPSLDTDVVAEWNPALATYNLTASEGVDPSSQLSLEPNPAVAANAETPRGQQGFLEGLRPVTGPVPAAWWLVLAGVLGVVGVARRRTA